MKKQLVAAAILSTLLSGAAFAQQIPEGAWMVRARAVHLQSDNGGSTTPALNLSMNNKWMPEVDVSYFFSPNVAVELVLTVPQKHTLYANGTDIGTFKHLPPVLLAQYHFPMNGFKPYVGAGANYTRFSSVNLKVPGADIDRNSWGPALQVGVDIALNKGLYLNLDMKKVYIRTDVSLGGTTIGDFKADPLLVGVGLGWRF